MTKKTRSSPKPRSDTATANGEAAPTRRKRSKKPVANGHAELLRSLWEAAVAQRGTIEPSDYKRFVLPLIFLRFLSLRYERRRAELERCFDDPSSEYHTKDAKRRRAILDDADEYRKAGAMIVPEAARWSNIVAHAREADIKSQLDGALETLENAYPDQLRGLLPRVYAGSNLDAEGVRGLINLFSRDVFEFDHGGEDLIGRVYEYFIGEFANSEGKRGGEYFTPVSIVRTLVAMIEPTEGVVFDPCCGSGGMFVQSDVFTKHSGNLSFRGQESKDFTQRLCLMNLFIHGIRGEIKLGNSYFDDKFGTLRAEYILANPPFNDGAKSADGWGADRITDRDQRLALGGERMQLSPRNANTMWMLHFLHHLKDGGTAGFVMAAGELTNGQTARLAVRRALVDGGYVDCVVQLSGQLFANTQIPCSLWLLSKNRNGAHGFRRRMSEVLFIDGRKLGALIPGSRKQRQLAAGEIEQIAATCREFRRERAPQPIAGFCRAVGIDEIRGQRYALSPGRYVGSPVDDMDDLPIEEVLPSLVATLESQLSESRALGAVVMRGLREVADVIA